MKVVFICLVLVAFAFADKEYYQAELRERLSKAKTIKEALLILRTADPNAPMSLVSAESLRKEYQQVVKTAQRLSKNSNEMSEPRNGGCEPRIICKPVPIDRVRTNDIMSFPQCLEVHECGGCCREPQFSCVPVEEKPVQFGPVLMVSMDELGRYEVPQSLTFMNHTKCDCRCSISSEQCRQKGEILNARLCKCVKPRCVPDCSISATCSIVEIKGIATPRCTCRRPLNGQPSNYCQNQNERPDRSCTFCTPY